MRKKDLPEVILRVVMSLYHGKKRKFEWDVSYLKNSGYKWIYIKAVSSPLLFALAMDVFTENARKELMNKILYVDDLVLISESIENLKEKFIKWKEAFESKTLKMNLKENQNNGELFER